MNETRQIGFSQRIQLEWLERTAGLLLAGNARGEIQTVLQDLLRDQLSVGSDPKRGNREKAITILLKIWVSVPRDLEALRDDGLQLLGRLPPSEHLPVHWGMTMAVYPFWGVVAEAAGRLLRLQGSSTAAQIQRRVREQFGERETVERAARRVLRCFVDWGVLQETAVKGVYRSPTVRSVRDKQLAAWLLEATLIATGSSSGTLEAIVHLPALFPFAVGSIRSRDLEGNSRLEVSRQGLDRDVVTRRGTWFR